MTYSKTALTYGDGAIFSGGSSLEDAIESAKGSAATQKQIRRPEFWVGIVVLELPGRDGAVYQNYDADAWEPPSAQPLMAWSAPPPGKKVAHVSVDGKVTMLGGASLHVAHDSGDGADINHCPFCGSGSVIGGHSGTVECEFCHRFFTVQVQPEFRGMPQTIDGQPYNVPGMPGQGPDAGAAGQERADQAGDALTGEDPDAPGSEATDPAAGPPEAAKPAEEKAAKPNPFAAKALLVTKEGVALPGEAYLQHLALSFADDREAVLAQVKAENA